jgi:hypothetical protein
MFLSNTLSHNLFQKTGTEVALYLSFFGMNFPFTPNKINTFQEKKSTD